MSGYTMILNRILRPLFYIPFRIFTKCETVPLEPLKTANIDPELTTVYITVSSSLGNLLCIERVTNKLNMPSPFHDIKEYGFKVPRICCLRKPGFFSANAGVEHDISETLQKWYEYSITINREIQIIPINVLWSRNPGYENNTLRGVNISTPSLRKFFNLIFNGRDNCTIVSEPFLISQFAERLKDKNAKFTKDLNRTFKIIFVQKVRSIVGRPFPNRQRVINSLLEKPNIQRAIDVANQADNKGIEYHKQRARNILNVMVADTRYPLLKFLNSIISVFWSRLYQGQTIIGADRVRKLVQTGHEIIYIPCHRSHMDYILLTFVLFHEGLPLPQIASGDNLNFFPIGALIRRCGSYFIRRKMRGDEFYITIFREYLNLLFESGYATEFFIEGGRSRTGRTLPPRTGMVSMTVQSQLRDPNNRPVAFVPTYLGYEHITEVSGYMNELSGAAKKKESAAALLGIFKRLRNYGRGYVTFGDPVIVPKFLNEHVPDWKNFIDPTGQNKPSWLVPTVNAMADKIITNLNDSASVNGINLCALAIMSATEHAMTSRHIIRCLDLYLKVLEVDPKRRKSIPQVSSMTLLEQAVGLNKFNVYDIGDDAKFFRPNSGQVLQLTYLSNGIVHLFALPALIANIILRNGHISKEDIRNHTHSLFYFLHHELYAPVEDKDLDTLIDKYTDVFLTEGYITRDGNMYYISGDGLTEFYILSRCIYPNLVRYLVAVTALKNTKDGTTDVQTFVQKCIIYSKRLPTDVTNNSPEFADPILFKIMCDTFIRHSYFYIKDDGKIIVNKEKVEKLAQAAAPLLRAKDVRILNGRSLARKLDGRILEGLS